MRITEKPGPARDHPNQDGEGAGTGGQRDPKAPAGDHLSGLGGLRDLKGVRSQKFNEGIFSVALSEGGEALLELRENGLGGSDRTAAGQAAQGSANRPRRRWPESRSVRASGGHTSMGKGERIGDRHQHQRRHQSAASEDGHARSKVLQRKRFFQLRNICVSCSRRLMEPPKA